MGITFGNLLSDEEWVPMELEAQQYSPAYWYLDGDSPLADAPVDFVATFKDAMDTNMERIDVMAFNRNPLRVIPNFVVPRHQHNLDEMILVFAGQYAIDHGPEDDETTTVVKAGQFFLSRAGTPYTMTAGPEGVTYIETWPKPVTQLETTWFERGWVKK